jgi:predicted transport protein
MKPEEMIRELPAPPVEEWIARLPAGTHRERHAFLVEQGLSSNHARAVLWWAKHGAALVDGRGELIDRQYAGKEALRPIYERLAEFIVGLGEDVDAGPRGTYVSFDRPKQFALVRPSTKTRIDVGLRLPGVAPTERLRDAGSFGSGNITHRVALASPDEIDAELEGWLRDAYDARG